MSVTPSWIPEIEVKYEYAIPNKYLEQSDSEGKKGNYTYVGPEKIWIFVNNETKKIEVNMDAWAYDEENEHQEREVKTFCGLGHTPVLIDATKQPLLATLIWQDTEPHENYPCKAWRDPDTNEVIYWETDPLIPDDAYDQENIVYDFDKKEFVTPFPYERPGMTEEEWEDMRSSLINTATEDLNGFEMSDPNNAEHRAKLVAYKTALENIWTKYPKEDGWRHYHIPFLKHPFGDAGEGNRFDASESIDPDRSTVDNND